MIQLKKFINRSTIMILMTLAVCLGSPFQLIHDSQATPSSMTGFVDRVRHFFIAGSALCSMVLENSRALRPQDHIPPEQLADDVRQFVDSSADLILDRLSSVSQSTSFSGALHVTMATPWSHELNDEIQQRLRGTSGANLITVTEESPEAGTPLSASLSPSYLDKIFQSLTSTARGLFVSESTIRRFANEPNTTIKFKALMTLILQKIKGPVLVFVPDFNPSQSSSYEIFEVLSAMMEVAQDPPLSRASVTLLMTSRLTPSQWHIPSGCESIFRDVQTYFHSNNFELSQENETIRPSEVTTAPPVPSTEEISQNNNDRVRSLADSVMSRFDQIGPHQQRVLTVTTTNLHEEISHQIQQELTTRAHREGARLVIIPGRAQPGRSYPDTVLTVFQGVLNELGITPRTDDFLGYRFQIISLVEEIISVSGRQSLLVFIPNLHVSEATIAETYEVIMALLELTEEDSNNPISLVVTSATAPSHWTNFRFRQFGAHSSEEILRTNNVVTPEPPTP